MKIWHISDTHGEHAKLKVPKGIDVVIHSGDSTNYKSPQKNHKEWWSFKDWFVNLDIPHKIYVAGNHDATLWHRMDIISGFHYLENQAITIDGVKFYGTPVNPLFCDWYFQYSEDKLKLFWELIPDDTDVLITHTPPLGTLDFCVDGNVGSSTLKERLNSLNLKAHLFGHVHDEDGIINSKLINNNYWISNASVVDIALTLISDGNIIII